MSRGVSESLSVPNSLPMCSFCDVSVDNITKKSLPFERKVSYSGKSLIITVPEDLAKHMHIDKSKHVRIFPVDEKKFLVEVLD